MNASAIRDRLYDYIRVADDKKIKAIYMMLEDEITEQTEWWKDVAFVAELEKEFEAWETGKDKGYSLSTIKAEITTRTAKKRGSLRKGCDRSRKHPNDILKELKDFEKRPSKFSPILSCTKSKSEKE